MLLSRFSCTNIFLGIKRPTKNEYQASICGKQKIESGDERVALQESLTQLKTQHQTLLERHDELVERFDLLQESYKTSVTSHKSMLERHTGDLGKLEKKVEEQGGDLEQQQEETRKGFKSLTNHIMNHIAENNANLEKATMKEKAESEEKLGRITKTIQEQLKEHSALHAEEKNLILKNSEDIKQLKTKTEGEFADLKKIEEARKLDEKEEKEKLKRLEKQSSEGLEKLNLDMEGVQERLASNQVERQAIRQDLYVTKDEINRDIISIKKDISENASKDEETEKTLRAMRNQIEVEKRQNVENQKKVNQSLKSLTEKSTAVHQSIEGIKSEMIDEESRRRAQEGKFQNHLDSLRKEHEKQKQEIVSMAASKKASDENSRQEVERLEGVIEKSGERQKSTSAGLQEKIEATRELVGQSQRGIRAIIREECDAVAASSRVAISEVISGQI